MVFNIRRTDCGLQLRKESHPTFECDMYHSKPGEDLPEKPRVSRVTLECDLPGLKVSKGTTFYIPRMTCELCRQKVCFELFPAPSQWRCQRRMERVLHDRDFSLVPGPGRIICISCLGSDVPAAKVWLSNLSQKGVFDVIVRYTVMIHDRSRTITEATCHFEYGRRSQGEVEHDLFEAVAPAAMQYILDEDDGGMDSDMDLPVSLLSEPSPEEWCGSTG